METSDQYEQQLLAVFESCDDYYQNSLSSDGLYQLCEKLQLEDHYHKIVKCVLGDSEDRRITFNEFKDGLLKHLHNSNCEERNGRDNSPVRETSAYVLSKKKYGRRSRSDSIENDNHTVDDADDFHHSVHSCSTDGHSEPEESVPKKRKIRSFKLNMEDKDLIVNEEECLITAWSNVSGGINNGLTKYELVNVFQCVGLESGSEEAAQRVFENLEVEENGSITLQELLEFIRSGVIWSKDMRNQELEAETSQKSANFEFFDSSALGCVTGAYLVEQWEAAGVPGAENLLNKLGLSVTQQIDVSSLAGLLAEELKILNDGKNNRSNLDPSTVLLLAISVLQNIHLQSLKSLIEHMNAEKEKLRNDVIEANQRALLLAQEIDDHHSKLEHSTQQQVKTLEQRHAEKIRELTMQLKSDQDAQASHALLLEGKVSALEEERNKCKAIIQQLEHENKSLEQEHRVVVDQLTLLQRMKDKLELDMQSLSNLQIKATEMEAVVNNNEIMSLLERIQFLETENTNLRDRNDELSTEVEDLSTKLLNTSIKKRSSPVNSLCIGGDESMDDGNIGAGGTKRRGVSYALTESAEDSGGEEGSPRLGKVRKCAAKEFATTTRSLEELQIHGGGRGESLEDDVPDRVSDTIREEVRFDGKRNRRNISFSQELQQVLDEAKESNAFDEKMKLIEERLIRLDGSQSNELITHVKDLINALKGKHVACEECSQKNLKLKEYEEELRKSKEETKALEERCKNLETSLELLKEEYEKTEDYWSEKLEEERSFFEEEQRVSDKKYADLIDKIIAYDEMVGSEREQRQRLETIDEKDGFEKQVMDLEQECFKLRTQFTDALKEKESEIEKLKEEIKTSKVSCDSHDASVQVTDCFSKEKSEPESQHKAESDKKCKTYSRRSFTFSSGDRKSRYSGCCHISHLPRSACTDLRNLQDTKNQLEQEIETLIEERNVIYKEIMEKRRDINAYAFNGDSISNKFNEMEEKCHSLMTTLHRQQRQTEEILKSTWKQHKTEVKDLKSVLKMTEEKLKRQTDVIHEQLKKLARTDLLVKDLFVENAFLVSSVQKLEQQCQNRKADDATV